MQLRKHSKKRADLEKEIRKSKQEVREGRYNMCESSMCRSTVGSPVDVSHNYSVKHFQWLAADKRNMTLLRRDLHDAWECSRLFELDQGLVKRIIGDMYEMALEEVDLIRRESMMSHVKNKLFKLSDFPNGKELANELFKLIEQ